MSTLLLSSFGASAMRAGILIIGSLFWRKTGGRAKWRDDRLSVGDRERVRVPIRYGRLSQYGTYTMTFASRREMGAGFVVRCQNPIRDFPALLDEAIALWKAEYPRADPGSISDHWGGCVGVLFRDGGGSRVLRRRWSLHFREHARSVWPVGEDGLLRKPWPVSADDHVPVDFDILLATATRRTRPRPTANEVAQAWLTHPTEEYFFQDVRHGIRTRDDLAIWQVMQAKRPGWGEQAHPDVAKILNDEATPRGESE